MSQFYRQKKELAAQLFIELAANTPPDYWDWNKIAARACDAADAFDQVFEKRCGGQPLYAALPAEAIAAISGAAGGA